MAKFCGAVGFICNEEVSPGVWSDNTPVEKTYCGDYIRDYRRYDNANQANDNLTFSSQISIISDSYACDHKHLVRYVKIDNAYWEVTGIEPKYPRILLTIGGVYNGPTASATE